MVDFKFYLNRQGVRGQRGEKGDKGFSPSITVKTDTKTEYVLHVQNETDDTSFDTTNLKEGLIPEDLGGTVVRYNRATGEQYYGEIETATEDQLGLVNLTEDVFNPKTETSVLTAQQAIDNFATLGITNNLYNEVLELKEKTDETNTDLEELNGRVVMNSNDIKTLSYDLAETKIDVAQNTSDIANLKTHDTTNKDNIEKLKTDKQDKLIAGENITIEGNIISATGGGGGVGDVTSNGDNVFTGNNTFNQTINSDAENIIKFGNKSNQIFSDGNEFNLNKSTISSVNTGKTVRVVNTSTGETGQIQTLDTVIKAQGDIILAPFSQVSSTDEENIVYQNIPDKIRDKNGKIILSQGNVTAGENVTITETPKGLQISATGGVTNITGTTPIVVDEDNNITLVVDNQTIQVVDGKLHANMDELGNEVNDLAGRITANEADITAIQNDITELTGQIESGAKIDDVNITTTSCFSSDKTTDFVNQQMSALSTTIDAVKQDKLVAGDNISMVNNTDGTVTISSSSSSTYELPAATVDTLGGIKVGEGLSITEDGILSATGGSAIDDVMLGHGTQTYNNVSTTSDRYYAKNLYYNHNAKLSTWLNVGSSYLETNNLNCTTSLQVGGTRNSYGVYSGAVNITGVSGFVQGEITCGNTSNQMFGIRSAGGSGILFNPQSLGGQVPALYRDTSLVTASDLYPLYTTKNVTAGDGITITVDKSNITLSVDTTKFVSIDTYNELLVRVEALEGKVS